jgi:signal transduction histidine kinase
MSDLLLGVSPPETEDAAEAKQAAPSLPRREQRRIWLIVGLCGATALIEVILFIFALLTALFGQDDSLITDSLARGAALAVVVLGAWFARRSQMRLAGACLVGSVLATVWMVQSGTVASNNNVAFFMYFGLYPLVIMLSGVATSLRVLFITAGVAAGLSLLMITLLPDDAVAPTLLAVLLVEAVTTGIMFLFVSSYLSTEHDLAETQLAYERMKQIDNLKEQFITSVNHELRNPIMAMLGYLDLLRIQRNRASLERLDMIVDEANQAGQDLRALLNSILETRRLDQGIENFIPQAVNVRDVIAVAVRLIDPREATIQDRELRIRVAPHFHIWGDPVHLQQIFTNLISNAAKYSPPDAPIEVFAANATDLYEVAGRWGRTETQSKRMVEIMVRDYGLGIPPDQAPLLFQRFARLPRDLASKVVGNGLGLYLCRALTEVMGGKIWVESSGVPGRGTTFFVHLPVPPSEPEPPSVIETSSAELRL